MRATSGRPGNARGNALSTNAVPDAELSLTKYSWVDEGGLVTVTVPLIASGDNKRRLRADSVTASFGTSYFDMRFHDERGCVHRLHVGDLPCDGLLPQVTTNSDS